MSINEHIINTLKRLDICVNVNEIIDKNSESYIIIIPLYDGLDVFADNKPSIEVSEVELAVYSKRNYLILVKDISTLLIDAGFTITNRRYIEYEKDTKLHHYIIDVAMEFCY
ncbi:MAG: hypothetical protein GYA02_06985 [Clostridiaceae bacterium]|nr:hypothetical protein [Clostridiaceae bacterium]